jgi:hypothetical protein
MIPCNPRTPHTCTHTHTHTHTQTSKKQSNTHNKITKQIIKDKKQPTNKHKKQSKCRIVQNKFKSKFKNQTNKQKKEKKYNVTLNI